MLKCQQPQAMKWYYNELGLVAFNGRCWFIFDSYLNQVYGHIKQAPMLLGKLTVEQAYLWCGYSKLGELACK